MGIIVEKIKKKIQKNAINVVEKGANAIATASQFSPNQIDAIDKKKKQYQSNKPSTNDDVIIKRSLGAVGIEVFQAYLPQINDLYFPVDMSEQSFDTINRIRYFDITKWVLDVEENYIDKLVNVYHVLSEEECNIALIYHRTKTNCKVTFAVVNNGDNEPSIINAYEERIIGAIKGNFPGVEINCKKRMALV